jgi:hypothetical protein
MLVPYKRVTNIAMRGGTLAGAAFAAYPQFQNNLDIVTVRETQEVGGPSTGATGGAASVGTARLLSKDAVRQ